MKAEWIRALGNLTHGIYVLTSAYEGKINGMIASWVSQISYEPLLITVAVHPNRYSHQLIEGSARFGLNSLAKEKKDFLNRFKGPEPDAKFAGLDWKPGKTGCPILKDCTSCLECVVVDQINPGNHTIFIGEVAHVHFYSDAPSLTTHDYSGIYLGNK